MIKKGFYFLVIFIVISIVSCSNTNWYPEGNVEIVSYRVYDEAGNRNCAIFYKIENTGLGQISSTNVSFSVKTNSGEYYITVVDETIVLPGEDIFGNSTVTFFDNTETVSGSADIVIQNFFFE